jgi:D-sedoheptulose 7-phosphate isomerase
MTALFEQFHAEHLAVFQQLTALAAPLEQAAQVLSAALKNGNKIMWCGNGGSAADAQHLAAELTGRFVGSRIPLAGLALATDASALTCTGNDFGFDAVFERQVLALGQSGDCLVAISTSGQSPNVLRAVQAARGRGITTLALTGRDGGPLAPACDHAIVVPSNTTARIQEAHIFIGHLWCAAIEQHLGLAA